MQVILSADIGGTGIRVAVYPLSGSHHTLAQKRIPTRGEGSPVDRLIGLLEELWPAEHQVMGIAAGVPGPVDPFSGIIFTAPNIADWKNLPLAQILSDHFHVPAFIGNDANMACLGEWKFGAGQGHSDMIYITVSTGIGTGVLSNNHLLLGAKGLATEMGHSVINPEGPLCGCGHRGHIEAYSSGTAIANYVTEQIRNGRESSLNHHHRPTAKEIADAALSGDSLAQEAFDRAGRYLGIGISNFLHTFNPSIIVLGGGVSQTGDLIMRPLRRAMEDQVLSQEYLKDLIIAPAELQDNCGLLGGLAYAQINLK
jgi:glucokinase